MNITPQSWRKISELLDTALEMSAEAREAWLGRLSSTLAPDELSIIEPLKKLLAQQAHVETNDILQVYPDIAGALIAEGESPSATAELRAGAEIGGYRLVRELGQGGMGSVWLAEQIDGRLQRTVALKLPYAGPQQRELAKRFLQERDILAKLEHPNIARLYDADAANPDRPFLVLEYVDGIAIDEYCRTRRLSLKERLQLFRQVFSAVQYAHTRLVIHRDLKPSNILVTAEGVVRLLDFGIAKVLAQGNDLGASLTEVGSVVLTPSFASPEQIMGVELTTTSDVYALGVVLYELLTGARPYCLQQEGRRALEDAIIAGAVVVPSEAAQADRGELNSRHVARELQGDLDTILLKALKKRPEERYPTAAAFADDIDRYLRGEPVLAQADSTWYRLRKFAGRNRLAVGATLAVVASLGIGLSVALWQLHTARIAQQHAESVKEFIASIFRSADPFFTGNKSMSAVDLLALARQRIDKELQDQPESAVELLNVVGESQLNLEANDAARATLEKALALGKNRNLDAAQLARAEAKLAAVLVYESGMDAAVPLLDRAIPVLRESGPKFARALTDALQVKAFIDADAGKYDAAIAYAEEAYRVALAALGPKDSETILAKRNWAQQISFAGRPKDALPLAEQAFKELNETFAPGERNALVPQVEGFYGRLLVELGDLSPGVEHLKRAIDQCTEIYGPKSTMGATFLSYLMLAQLRLGNNEGYIDAAARSLEASVDERNGARPLMTLGDAYYRARKFPQAEEHLRRSIEAIKKYDTGAGSWLPVAQAMHAGALVQLGRSAEAMSLLEKNLPLVGDSKEAITMPHWAATGLAHRLSGQWADSEQAYRRLLERTTDSVNSARWRTEAWNGIGLAQLALGHTQEAETSLRESLKAVRIAYVNPTPPTADALVSLSRALLQQNRAGEALPLIEEADRFWKTYSADHPYAGEAAYWHGQALIATGKKSEARNALTRAARILKQSPIASDRRLAEAAVAIRR